LGAGRGALRRTLLAESLLLCGAGAVLGVVLAWPFVSVVVRYAARFSIRALDVSVDTTVLWVGAGLAIAAAVLLAYVPRLPSPHAPNGLGLATSVRITPGTSRRLRAFATVQIAFSFVLLAGAGMLLATLVALQNASTGYRDMRQVLALDMPPAATGVAGTKAIDFYREVRRRVASIPGVERAAVGTMVPWRDPGLLPGRVHFAVEGYTPADGEEQPAAEFRVVGSDFFAAVGVRLIAGREFTEDDRGDSEPVSIVSQSVAQRLF